MVLPFFMQIKWIRKLIPIHLLFLVYYLLFKNIYIAMLFVKYFSSMYLWSIMMIVFDDKYFIEERIIKSRAYLIKDI